MDNLKIGCRSCGKEIEAFANKTVTCGCSNMTTIRGGVISAIDLSQVLMLNSPKAKEKSGVLTNEDLAFQEARRQRKVRKLDFEIR
jgi:hypothetical protein